MDVELGVQVLGESMQDYSQRLLSSQSGGGVGKGHYSLQCKRSLRRCIGWVWDPMRIGSLTLMLTLVVPEGAQRPRSCERSTPAESLSSCVGLSHSGSLRQHWGKRGQQHRITSLKCQKTIVPKIHLVYDGCSVIINPYVSGFIPSVSFPALMLELRALQSVSQEGWCSICDPDLWVPSPCRCQMFQIRPALITHSVVSTRNDLLNGQ